MRSQETRRTGRDDRVRAYFYGRKTNFFPHIFEVKFADIKIFKIGGKLLVRAILKFFVKSVQAVSLASTL